jgi:PAS domain S-box-containing protein
MAMDRSSRRWNRAGIILAGLGACVGSVLLIDVSRLAGAGLACAGLAGLGLFFLSGRPSRARDHAGAVTADRDDSESRLPGGAPRPGDGSPMEQPPEIEARRRGLAWSRMFFDMPFIGMVVVSPTTQRPLKLNGRMCDMLGYRHDELMRVTWPEMMHPDDRADGTASIARLFRGELDGYRAERRLVHRNGSAVHVVLDIKCTRRPDRSVEYIVCTVEDVSARKQAEAQLRRQRDFYAALSATNAALVQRPARQALFDEVCRVAIEIGGFLFAWIGEIDPATGVLRPVARHGNDSGALDRARISVYQGAPEGRGPVGQCVRKGRPVACNDFHGDPTTAPWRDVTLPAGINAVASFPVFQEGRTVAVLAIYSRQAGVFDEETMGLLGKIAESVSFGLDNLAGDERREQMTHELQVAETRWRFALEGAGHAVWDWDVAGGHVYYSAGWRSLLGSEGGEPDETHREWEDRLHPDDRPRVLEALRRHCAGKAGMYVSEHRLRCNDGSWRWVLERGQAVRRAPTLEPLQVIATVTDLTPVRQAEAALTENERRFRLAVEESPFPAMIHAEDGEVLVVNRSWCAITGYTADELTTVERWLARACADAGRVAAAREVISNLYAGEHPQARAWEIRCRDGSRRTWEFHSFALGPLPDGRRTAISMAADVTDRQRVEASLAHSVGRYRTLLSTVTDGVHIVDSEGCLVEASPAFLAHLGYDAEEAAGLSIGDWDADWADLAQDRDVLAARVDHGQSETFERRHRRKDGSLVDVEITATGVEIGSEVLLVCSARDVSARKEAERRRHMDEARLRALLALNDRSETSDEEELLLAAAAQVASFTGSRAAYVVACDHARRLCRTASWPEDQSDVRPMSDQSRCCEAPDAAWMHCAADGRPLRWNEPPGPGTALQRYLGVPVMHGGRMQLVVAVANRPHDYDETDLHQLELFADGVWKLVWAHRSQLALAEEEAKFRGLAEQSLVGIYTVDAERILYANPRMAEIFGYDQGALTGMPLRDLVHPDDIALVESNIRARIAGETGSIHYSFTGVRRDGATVRVDVHGAAAMVDGRRVVIGALLDATEQDQAERRIQEYIRRLEHAVLGTVDAISRMMDLRDPYTSGHERRVGELAAVMGAELGLDEHAQRGLRITGLVHDIGKITVPAEILARPGRLSEVELEMVRTHAQQGYEILRQVDFPWPVAEVVLQHHERMNGSGYPRGLSGEQICLEARIVAVADVVESMASHRPYRPGLGIDAALAEIESGAGTLYDPSVAAVCLRLFRDKGYTLPG